MKGIKGRVTTQIRVATDLFWQYQEIRRLQYENVHVYCGNLPISLLRHDNFRNIHRIIIIIVIAIVRAEYASSRESARQRSGAWRASGAERRHFRASSGRALGHGELLGERAIHGERRHDEETVVFLQE